MIQNLILASMLSLAQPPGPMGEPDGSRTIGIVPPFKAEPAPPAWLRTTSHALATGKTRHYIYEAYAGPNDQWLVRYQMLPESDERAPLLEQAFLFASSSRKKPQKLNLRKLTFNDRKATWNNLAFTLVDHRDLMKP